MSYINRSELQQRITDECDNNPTFREHLISNPHIAVGELIGMDIPATVNITVHEESLTDIHLVLESDIASALSESDLELVSGGLWGGGSFPSTNCGR